MISDRTCEGAISFIKGGSQRGFYVSKITLISVYSFTDDALELWSKFQDYVSYDDSLLNATHCASYLSNVLGNHNNESML